MIFNITKPLKHKVIHSFPAILHPFIETTLSNRQYLFQKTFNLALNSLEHSQTASLLWSYPYQATIDPTNICNLKCPLCPTWQDIDARPKGRMSLDAFKSIINALGKYLFTLNLCNWGEPFLNPDLHLMVKYAKSFNIVVGLSTNLNHLPDDIAKKTINSGIDIIVISLDGISQSSYEKYRQGGDIQKVFANIERLNYYKAQSANKPLLIWQFLVNRHNENELDLASEIADKMGLLFQPSPMRSSMGKELTQPLHQRVKEMIEWFPENPKYRKYPLNINPQTRTSQNQCKWLWNSIVINWDGSISPCCGVFDKCYDFGNIFKDNGINLKEVWNSPQYRLARKMVSAYMNKTKNLGRLIKEADNKHIICANCIRYGFLED